MLEETIDDRRHADVLADAGHAGHEAADPADEQVDLYTGAAGAIERLDDTRIDERIHFGHDESRFPLRRVLGLAIDHPDGPAQIVHRSDDELKPRQRRTLPFNQLL